MAQTALCTYVPAGLGNALYKDTLPSLPSGKTTWGVATITTKVGDIPTNTSGTFKRTVIQAAGEALEFELVNSGTGVTSVVSILASNIASVSIATS